MDEGIWIKEVCIPKIVVGHYINKSMLTNMRERTSSITLRSSSVTFERKGVVALPCSTDRRASLGVQVSSAAKPTVLLSCRGQSTPLTVLVHWVHNPVDAGILADHGVLWVDQDDLEVLVRGILHTQRKFRLRF
jgi:hypothetical protein